MTGEPAITSDGGGDRLSPEDDYLLQKDVAAAGTVLTAYNGGNPLVDPPAFGYPENMQVEIERRLILEGDNTKKMNESIFLNPDSGWGQIKQFMDGIFQQYKTQNSSQLIKKPQSEEEWMQQAQQMRPVQVDPNEVANMRQLAVKLDAQMKAIDPRTSFWTDPRTKGYADWLNRESGPGSVGFMESGDQSANMGLLGRSAYVLAQAEEGIKTGLEGLIYGGWDIGRSAIQALGGPDIGAIQPTNFMTGPDGELVTNGGKAPSFIDSLSMAWAYATDQNIQKFAEDVGRAEQWEQANRAGLAGIATSVSRLGGELAGMAPGFGAFAKVGEATLGSLTMKGLQQLGTLRLAKGLGDSERALKLIGAMSKGVGQAAGMAAYESVTNGSVNGYGASYLHGLTMAPILMTMGALGKKTEWFAANRAKMPEIASRAVAGALEGAGFAGVETLAPELLPAAWGFIRDPNQDTFEAYAKNMMAFALTKMATGRTTGAVDRLQLAEKVARGEASTEEVAAAPVPDEAKLGELGHASMRAREGRTPEERQYATERKSSIENELNVEEMGKGPAEEAVRDYQQPERNRMPSREEIAAVREMPEGPEKRRLTIEMLARGRRAFGKAAGQFQADVAKQELGRQETELAQQQEELEAGSTAKALLGNQSKSDYRSELRKRLAEKGIEMGDKDIPAEEGKKPGAGESSEDAEIAAMAKKAGMDENELRKEMGLPPKEGVEAARATNAEHVEELRRGEYAHLREGKPLTPEQEFARGIEPEFRVESREKGPPPPKPLTPEEELLQGSVSRGTSEQRSGQSRTAAGERAGPQSLQLPPTRQVEPTEGAEQVSAADIYSEMQGRQGSVGFRIPFTSKRIFAKEGDPVQVAMRGGKVPGRGTLGFFKHHENVARTKEGRDLVVAAHEWSHAMHRHTVSSRGGKHFINNAKAQLKMILGGPDGKAIQGEIDEMLKDYHGQERMPQVARWMETWSEWHARNLLGEVGLDEKFPAVSKFMRTWLAAPEQAKLRDQYQRIQSMLYRYNAQGSLGRLRQSRMSGAAELTETEAAKEPSRVRKVIAAVNKAMLDDMADLKASQDKWMKAIGRNPEDVSIMDDPARLYDALRMTANKTVEHFVMDGVRQPDGTKVPGLKSIMDNVHGRTEDFTDYVVAKRSMDLYSKGKDVQLPPQDYVESIKQLEARNPDFAERLADLKRWTDALVDYVRDAGNIGADDAERIKAAYVVYIPFFRAIPGPAQHGKGRGVAERGTGLSRIKGSTYEIQDPFIALQQVARSMVAKAHQNQVMSALYKMAVGQESGGLATVVPRTAVPTDHPLRQLLDAIEAKVQLPGDQQHELESVFEALRDADALNPETITTFSQKVIPAGERSIIAFTPRMDDAEIERLIDLGAHGPSLRQQNNKIQWLEVDTKAYQALMGIDKLPQLPEAMQPMMKWMQAPRDVVRFFATGVSPGFVAANMVRDALSAPLFDRAGDFRPFGGFVKLIRGAIEYHRNGEMRELYEELGVKTSSFWTEGRQRSLIGEQTTLWQKAQAMADRIQNWFSHPENYIRMAEFKDAYQEAKAAGKGEMEARMLALEAGREITVNFARAGIWARLLNQTIPYFNAGLQGQRKLWGQLLSGGLETKGDEAKARVQRGAILNGIANITIPATLLWLLNKDEDWYQDLPAWRKINYFNFKIGNQITSVPKPFEAGTLFGSIPEIFLDRVWGHNPAGLKQALRSLAGPYLEGPGSLCPAFLKPVFEVATNRDLYTWRPITPEWISRSNPPEEWATFYTTETAKIMSRALGGILAPTEIEHLLGGYTANAGVSAMKMIDEIAGMKDHPGIAVNPMARFFRQQEHGQSSYVDQLYDLSVDLDQHEDTLDFSQKVLRRRVDAAKRQISDLRKSHRAGNITQEEAERRSYEIARSIVEAAHAR